MLFIVIKFITCTFIYFNIQAIPNDWDSTTSGNNLRGVTGKIILHVQIRYTVIYSL